MDKSYMPVPAETSGFYKSNLMAVLSLRLCACVFGFICVARAIYIYIYISVAWPNNTFINHGIRHVFSWLKLNAIYQTSSITEACSRTSPPLPAHWPAGVTPEGLVPKGCRRSAPIATFSAQASSQGLQANLTQRCTYYHNLTTHNNTDSRLAKMFGEAPHHRVPGAFGRTVNKTIARCGGKNWAPNVATQGARPSLSPKTKKALRTCILH